MTRKITINRDCGAQTPKIHWVRKATTIQCKHVFKLYRTRFEQLYPVMDANHRLFRFVRCRAF